MPSRRYDSHGTTRDFKYNTFEGLGEMGPGLDFFPDFVTNDISRKNNAGFELRVWLNARLEAMSRFLVQTLMSG